MYTSFSTRTYNNYTVWKCKELIFMGKILKSIGLTNFLSVNILMPLLTSL